MTSRLSLHRLVQLISLSIIVMLSLLGVWQVQRLRHEVAQANARVPSCLQSADVVEMFVRTSRHRVTDNMYFYLPASLELSHLMKLPNASEDVASEMQRTLHTSIDSWLKPDAALLDSLLHTQLMREQLPISYELQKVDMVNDKVTFRALHTQQWMPWNSDEFKSSAQDLADTLFVSDDYSQAYVLRYESCWKVVLRNEIPSLVVFLFFLLISVVVLILLRLRQQEAEATTQFVRNLSHELKTPIAVAQAAHEALLDFGADADVGRRQQLLRTSQRQIGQLQRLVTSLLDALRPQPQWRAPRYEELEVEELLLQLQDEHELGYEKPVSIFLEVQPNDLTFSTDRMMLRDLLNNLIDNAIKYSKEESVVDIRAWRDEAARVCIIEVADQGVGIAARDLRKVFRRFYRVEQGDLHTVRGYGLGLYHVNCLVRQLGGRISVQSELGQGSCFRVVLPLNYV
jgi:putative two component system sensor histidine kinase